MLNALICINGYSMLSCSTQVYPAAEGVKHFAPPRSQLNAWNGSGEHILLASLT